MGFGCRATASGSCALSRDCWWADPAILKLMRKDPFEGKSPAFIRALFYQYRFTTPEEKRQTGAWWVRKLLGVYLLPTSREVLDRL